jgi:protein-S-isoprenylcysteine O-methyltransferase Ste14
MSRLRATAFWLLPPTVIGVIFFLAAGRLDLPVPWALLGLATAFALLLARTIDPGLTRERIAPGPGSREHLTRPVAGVLLIAHWVLAGLDVGRFHWSPVPLAVQLAGLAGYAVCMAGVFWAMRTNPFYSSVVRIQTDRGHRPVTTGPYRFVRHPGYTGTILGMLCGAVALGSWVGVIPVLGMAALFLRRTLLEDRLLVRELAGYAEYARRVRYRLVAGVF